MVFGVHSPIRPPLNIRTSALSVLNYNHDVLCNPNISKDINSHLFELGRVLLGWRKKKDKSKRSPTKKTGASNGLEVRDDGSCDPLLDDGEDVVDNEDDADDEADEDSDGQKGIIHT